MVNLQAGEYLYVSKRSSGSKIL